MNEDVTVENRFQKIKKTLNLLFINTLLNGNFTFLTSSLHDTCDVSGIVPIVDFQVISVR